MKLRLHGHPADCRAAAMALRRTPGLHVQDQSPPYPDRTGELVRVYLTVGIEPPAGPDATAAGDGRRPATSSPSTHPTRR
jgi:hypothetical protein